MPERPSAEELRRAVADPLPLPGLGRTAERWEALMELGRRDLVTAKLVEPHHDAHAIWADLAPDTSFPHGTWAVWAADPPTSTVQCLDGGLVGRKPFCSGAEVVDRALVTVSEEAGSQLYAIDVAAARDEGWLQVADRPWLAAGMLGAGTVTLDLVDVPAHRVGGPAEYLRRPGFWWGAIGVAACWAGAVAALRDHLHRALIRRRLDDLGAVSLGTMETLTWSARSAVLAAAPLVDEQPAVPEADARRLAETVRAAVVAAADAALVEVQRGIGVGALATDEQVRATIDDLAMFIRQHHGTRDLAALGHLLGEVVEP